MPIDFPNSPSVNDEFTSGSTTWRWDGSVWKVIRDFAPTGATGPTGPTGSQGNTGVTGVTGINWRAAFDFVAYSVGDVVQYSGSTYYCNTAISAGESTSHIPGSSARWDLLSAKGNTGAQGSTGGTGPTGMAFAQPSEPADPQDGQIWLDTDGSVAGQQVVRWSKAPTGGTTSLTGADDNALTLSYTVGYEQVYRNGVLLSRGNDYTATNGTSITLTDATITGDIVEVFAVTAIGITDVYTQTQSNNLYVPKTLTSTTGDIIYASAANTPARLGIGSAGQVLTVASGVPSWATASSGANWTLLNAGGTALSGSSTVTISGISGKDKIFVLIDSASCADAYFTIRLRLNTDTGSNYNFTGTTISANATYAASNFSGEPLQNNTSYSLANISSNTSSTVSGYALITGANSSGVKVITSNAGGTPSGGNTQGLYNYGGFYNSSSTISSVSLVVTGSFDAGTIYVYTSA